MQNREELTRLEQRKLELQHHLDRAQFWSSVGKVVSTIGSGLLIVEAIVGLFVVDMAIIWALSRESRQHSGDDANLFLLGYLFGMRSNHSYFLAGTSLWVFGIASIVDSMVAAWIVAMELNMPMVMLAVAAVWLTTIIMVVAGNYVHEQQQQSVGHWEQQLGQATREYEDACGPAAEFVPPPFPVHYPPPGTEYGSGYAAWGYPPAEPQYGYTPASPAAVPAAVATGYGTLYSPTFYSPAPAPSAPPLPYSANYPPHQPNNDDVAAQGMKMKPPGY